MIELGVFLVVSIAVVAAHRFMCWRANEAVIERRLRGDPHNLNRKPALTRESGR